MEDRSDYQNQIRQNKVLGVVNSIVKRVTGNQIKIENEDGKIRWVRIAPPTTRPPEPPPITTTTMPTDVWTLKNLQEWGVSEQNGSFAAMGGHGQTNAILLQKPETSWVKSICEDNAKLWNWAAHPAGTIYLTTDNVDEVYWPVILISSREATYPRRQMVHVLDMVSNGQKVMGKAVPAVLLEGIKRSSDYSQYTPSTHPWLFSWVWTQFRGGGYGPSHTTADGKDRTFIMPLFDPMGGFAFRKGTYAFWVPADVLKDKIS